MSKYNRWGATAADVVAMYQGTVAADFGGDSVIEAAIDRAAAMVAGSINAESFANITFPHGALVVRATRDDTTAGTLPIVPAVSNTWRFFFVGEGETVDCQGIEQDAREVYAASVNATTGAVVLQDSLSQGDRVFATYEVDIDNAAFSDAVLAEVTRLGAAAEVGAKVYARGTDQWELVDYYQQQYDSMLARLLDGSLIPDSIRLARWCKEIERQGGGGGVASVLRYRG